MLKRKAHVLFVCGRNQWRSPMVLIVLAAFAIGLAVGAVGMAPWWWKHRSVTMRERKAPVPGTDPEKIVAPGPQHGL